MSIKMLSKEGIHDVTMMLGMNKDVVGAKQQLEKYKNALKEISNLIKMLKANRNMKLSRIVGGNLVVAVDNKEAIHELQDRRKQIEIAINGIEEQIRHREDNLLEAYFKAYDSLRRIIPVDMRKI